jgi:salicylate hydroxylase
LQGAWLCHRTDLHGELKRLAIGEDGAGPPARLHLGQEVVSCDPVTGTLALKNGDVREADLILGCDGIHVRFSSSMFCPFLSLLWQSIIRTSVLGYVQQALPSGMSTFRCLFDATKLEGLADMEWFTEGMSGGRVRLGL